MLAGINSGVGSVSLLQEGIEARRRHHLPLLAGSQVNGALTEPEAGSDVTAMQSTDVLQPDCVCRPAASAAAARGAGLAPR